MTLMAITVNFLMIALLCLQCYRAEPLLVNFGPWLKCLKMSSLDSKRDVERQNIRKVNMCLNYKLKCHFFVKIFKKRILQKNLRPQSGAAVPA